ncbi:MAG: 5-carboxymethyl-2-hydroxymuconate isomerase [Colwellia sp.]|nr:5-carboxymethyl-2-hydroxymuconate isomerase [Colwellia sp.]
MPHFILEHSGNLTNESLDLDGLFTRLIDEAVATGIFPLAGIRCRAHNCEYFRVADGTTTFGFIHLQVRIGSGRSEEQKASAAKVLFGVLTDHLSAIYESQGLAISFELTELPVHKFNQNNLRDYLVK